MINVIDVCGGDCEFCSKIDECNHPHMDDNCSQCGNECELAYTGAPDGLCCPCFDKVGTPGTVPWCNFCNKRKEWEEFVKKNTIVLTEFLK